jgi:hypothetical protein
MPFIAAGGAILGGLLGGSSARSAARTQAAAQTEAARIAAEEARFRPVGITTRFGSSQFQTDPQGRVSGASYELDPQLAAMQDRFLGLAGGGLTQAEAAQQQFAPLGQAAQGLFGLGQQYLAQSPEQAAQQYMMGQQNLLAPSRERQFAQLQNQLFQTGRGGLSVGATGARPDGGAGLGATTPELEAYYNAIAQQDAGLAAQAMQAGQQQTAFGAGLFGTGGNLLTQGYGGQAAALGPYQAYLQGATGLEALGQDPLNLGSALGGRIANPEGGAALLRGGLSAAGQNQFNANAFNPFATALIQGSMNPALRNVTGSGLQAAFSQTALGGSGFGTGLAYGNQDIGAFI